MSGPKANQILNEKWRLFILSVLSLEYRYSKRDVGLKFGILYDSQDKRVKVKYPQSGFLRPIVMKRL